MYYIIKASALDDIEILGVYSSLDKARKYFVKAANKAAKGAFVRKGWDTRFYEDCTIGITTGF